MNNLSQTQDKTAAAVANPRNEASLLPPVDVIEDSTGITLYADLPGVPRDKLQLRVEGDQLMIEGDIQLAVTQGMESTHAEVTLPRYRRAFTLSKELDAVKVSAELAQVVLRFRIHKEEHAQPRRIDVSVN